MYKESLPQLHRDYRRGGEDMESPEKIIRKRAVESLTPFFQQTGRRTKFSSSKKLIGLGEIM